MTEGYKTPVKFPDVFSKPKIWLLFSSLVILMPLVFYAYLGIFSRHQADDYCYAWNATSRSLIDSQTTWYRTDSSRYAATFIITLTELVGQRSISVLPSLTIFLWLLGTWFLFNKIQRLLNLDLPPIAVFLLGEIWIFFTLLLAPNRYQVLYWRAGLIIYLVPIVVLTWLVFLLLSMLSGSNEKRIPVFAGLLLLILFFFNGGFSETIAAVLVGMLSLSLLFVLLFVKGNNRKRFLTLVGFALLGALLSLAVLFFSPATRMRQGLIGPPPDLVNLVLMSFKNAFIYMYITLGDQSFTLLILLLISLVSAFSIISTRNTDASIKPSSLVSLLFLAPLGAFLWIVCVTAPFAYGESSYPEARVLINATMIMVLMVMVEGLVLGLTFGLLYQRSLETPSMVLRVALLIVLLLMCLYPIYSARQVYAVEYPLYKQRAMDWDQRDAYIRSQLAAGNKDITVTTFFMIGNVLEFNPDSGNWLNGCAAMYYGADSISAVSP
ncbi:MAG TPA: DUF6056 family protein [Anaerolineales bacterium]|nr:DUF6056 family protein [Anaerolineales bacterium]